MAIGFSLCPARARWQVSHYLDGAVTNEEPGLCAPAPRANLRYQADKLGGSSVFPEEPANYVVL